MDYTINYNSTNLENIESGELRLKYSAAGDRILRFYIDFRHLTLNLHKEVSAPEISILQNKVDTLMSTWDKKFETHLAKASAASGKELAENMVLEAEMRRENLKSTLSSTLTVDDTVNWEILKDRSKFKGSPFPEPHRPRVKSLHSPSQPSITFFQKLLGQRSRIEAEHQKALNAHKLQLETAINNTKIFNATRAEKLQTWEHKQAAKKQKFTRKQKSENAKVDALRGAWERGENQAILEHVSMVLDASVHDDVVPKQFRLQYQDEDHTLLMDYALPNPENLPMTKSVRYIASTGELKETQISEKEKKTLFDELCFQLSLRCIHEIFEADTPVHIQKIGFNGTVDSIDPSTGRDVHATILSLLVDRQEFLDIQLDRIEPKACFKALKGISAATLVGLTPVAPVMELDRDDSRFVDAKDVQLREGGETNLAAMDWEEFEHLVRDLFDREFALRGGEVKVTQSSSDGGVDAIAFDPDPISRPLTTHNTLI